MIRQTGFTLLPVILLLAVIAAVALMMTQKGLVDSKQAKNSIDSEQVRYTAEAILQKSVWELKQDDDCIDYALTQATGRFSKNDYNVELSTTSGSPVTLNVGLDIGGGVIRQFTRQLIMYQPVTEQVLNAEADTYIHSWYNSDNFNGGATIEQKSVATFDYRRSLLRFDLSPLSSLTGVQIKSANMELYLVNSPGTGTLEIAAHNMTHEWREWQVSWEKWKNGNKYWTAPGGDFDPTEVSRTLIDENNPGLYSWDVLELARGWIDSTISNYGVILDNTSTSSNTLEFASSEHIDSEKHPVLRITYQCECGQACP